MFNVILIARNVMTSLEIGWNGTLCARVWTAPSMGCRNLRTLSLQ